MFQPFANHTCSLKVWDSKSAINAGCVLSFYVIVALKRIFPNWSCTLLTTIICSAWKCSRIIAPFKRNFSKLVIILSINIREYHIILVVVRCVCDGIGTSQNHNSCFWIVLKGSWQASLLSANFFDKLLSLHLWQHSDSSGLVYLAHNLACDVIFVVRSLLF